MSVKGKVKRCNNEIKRLEAKIKNLECQNSNLRKNILKNDDNSEKTKLYANIIKFALTNHIGGLHGGMMIDYFGIDKMNDLSLDVESNHFEHSYMIRIR
ncbi:MAG: hypothetical protein HFJ35_02625 [Clostridia bacterium]|nr:hypothetical protein [Clostridia bacterium]